VKQTLARLSESAIATGLRDFLIIGGNAVIAHGVPRFTRDVDFVIPERSRMGWRKFLEREGFQFFHGTDAFQQFRDENGPRPRIDLMLVEESTWQKLYQDAWKLDVGGEVRALVASPQHIIAMKLKACRSQQRRSDAVDWVDIVELSLLHRFDPRSGTEFSDFVLQYGGETLLKRLIDEFEERRKTE